MQQNFCKSEKGPSPFFYWKKMDISSNIEKWIFEIIQDTPTQLLELKVSKGKKITVTIEHPEHVSIQQCIEISKNIAHHLGDESEDYEIEVSSPGIDKPFKHIVQYQKYTGKEVEVQLKNQEILKGTLQNVTPDYFILNSQPTNKKGNHKSSANSNPVNVAFQDVLSTKLILNF